ncbi:Transcriptional activator of proteases prtT [Psilocybe cubensis]|uniref:Transcriptional activator of proteases prtT n=2 Tax=Psilocybe cubensis TaxID=181762 RepID=A0ACB8HBM5_PSICU|nr:Transcriptional activator of proteases prtT [Psilocybe cubensis]KAH9485403.1 Transcriptional activator of proteases prtT [Psilocybe cubensis]
MSHSPSASISNSSESASKKRKASANSGIMAQSSTADGQTPQPTSHIPKRGARACTSCRKGKNRCEGEAPCRRCQASGVPCIFEKPEKKNVQGMTGAGIERLARLEGQYLVMQSQMIGMQSSLDRILSAVQPQHTNAGMAPPHPGLYTAHMEAHRDASGLQAPQRNGFEVAAGPARNFPPLPGFAPPPHKYANYGIVPSTAASSDDESEDTLPRASLNAPIEALQGLANAAAEAAAAPSAEAPRVKKRKRAEPIPRNAFPHVVEKGLVTDSEARELFNIFFAGCHLFIPLFDPSYDTYESLMERSPWTFDAILAVAGKIRSGNGPLSPTFYKCLEEAQGIARSSLFGPVVRKEAVQGMLLLAAWSTNGWLPSGHAMRMALDLGLHRALEKLVDDSGKQRTEEEERNLVVSARIWLCLYWFDHQMSLGTGRPIVLRDENTIRHCRVLLSHPMASPTDVRLISLVELIAHKTQIYDFLAPLNGAVNNNALSLIRRANDALDEWWSGCDELHRRTMDQDSLLRKVLAGELHYAKLWLVCVALRGVAWDKMPFEQRELAFQAKDAASNCLSIFLNSAEYRAALRYAVHDSLVTAAFSGLFLLKMANLFPTELDLGAITAQVEQLAQLLSDVAAERYALTLRIMLANLRRKVGLRSGINTPIPTIPPPPFAENMVVSPTLFHDPAMPPPFTMEELGFAWPNDRGIFSPTAIPLWLQEQSLADLGLPVNGSDGIFLQMAGKNGWTGDFAPMPEAW